MKTPRILVNFRVTIEQKHALGVVAARYDVTLTSIIRLLIQELLYREGLASYPPFWPESSRTASPAEPPAPGTQKGE